MFSVDFTGMSRARSASLRRGKLWTAAMLSAQVSPAPPADWQEVHFFDLGFRGDTLPGISPVEYRKANMPTQDFPTYKTPPFQRNGGVFCSSYRSITMLAAP